MVKVCVMGRPVGGVGRQVVRARDGGGGGGMIVLLYTGISTTRLDGM